MIELFRIWGLVVRVPSGWDFVKVDGRVFERCVDGHGVTRWLPR